MSCTKANIANSVYNQIGLPKERSVQLVETLLEIIKRALENGEDVLISGFGRFCVRDKNQRKGRNPQTGESMILDKRRVITFRCSGVLRDRVNN